MSRTQRMADATDSCTEGIFSAVRRGAEAVVEQDLLLENRKDVKKPGSDWVGEPLTSVASATLTQHDSRAPSGFVTH
jgi:hypothetical protein